MPSEQIDILGISYSTSDDKEVLDRIHRSVRARTRLTIIQPHFFHAVLGRTDSTTFDLYKKYDLALPDGYGMYLASKFLYGEDGSFKKVFNGTDLYEMLLKEANLHRWRVFFFGDTKHTLQALRRRLEAAFPGLIIAGTHHGFVDLEDTTVYSAINESNADILLLGMGTPKQDKWLWKYCHDLRVPVMMTVGAGIGFMSGEKIRAPKALRQAHLEWLFRFAQEPQRLWKRYLLGIPKFIFYIFLQRIRQR